MHPYGNISFPQEVLFRHLEHSKHLIFMVSPQHILQRMHHFCATHEDKINNYGFVFSTFQPKKRNVDSLRICQSFPCQILTNLSKFYPTTALHYMVASYNFTCIELLLIGPIHQVFFRYPITRCSILCYWLY